MGENVVMTAPSQTGPQLHVSRENVAEASAPTGDEPLQHNVFSNPDMLLRLFMHQTELGYKLVGFFTACATIYAAVVGVTLQQYFVALRDTNGAASFIGALGLTLSLLSLFGPVALELSLRHVETSAARYAAALGLPVEPFTVVRLGGRLAFIAFTAITTGWIFLLFRQ